MTDLRQACLRAHDLLYILPVANWTPMNPDSRASGDEAHETHKFWAAAFPNWASSNYVEKKLAVVVHSIDKYLKHDDADVLTFAARYINLFFNDDDAWDRALRTGVGELLSGSPSWADTWRSELLQCGYEFAVAAASAEPLSTDEAPAVLDLTSLSPGRRTGI